jgi:DNA polymerase-4
MQVSATEGGTRQKCTSTFQKFHGVGTAPAAKMNALNIHLGADLKQWSEADLVERFGKAERFYYQVARAEDDRPVNANRIRKSIGSEQSFAEDLSDLETMSSELESRSR